MHVYSFLKHVPFFDQFICCNEFPLLRENYTLLPFSFPQFAILPPKKLQSILTKFQKFAIYSFCQLIPSFLMEIAASALHVQFLLSSSPNCPYVRCLLYHSSQQLPLIKPLHHHLGLIKYRSDQVLCSYTQDVEFFELSGGGIR
jgi:hypothetical protein